MMKRMLMMIMIMMMVMKTGVDDYKNDAGVSIRV